MIIETIRNEETLIPRSSFPLQATEDAAFGLTPTDELVRVSLADLTLTTEATNVHAFELSADGRWVAWQDLARTNDDEGWPAGATYVKDRVDGTTTYLADTALPATFFAALDFVEYGVVQLQMGNVDEVPERVFFLSGAPPIDLPVRQSLLYRLDDGRWLVGELSDGPYTLFDPQLVEGRRIYDGPGEISRIENGIEIFASNAIGNAALRADEAPLLLVPWDGKPTRLAERAMVYYRWLRDGRIITPVDADDFQMGSLVVAAPRREEEQLIDDHVLAYATVNDDDEAIVYGVLDGDRTGVWVTKLAD